MKFKSFLVVIVAILFILPTSVYAVDTASQSNNLFKFQQKLAKKGNARAQYKLATMYEAGTGTSRNLDEAKHWYDRASRAGIQAANDRLTYLYAKEQGYNKSKNKAWLADLKKRAAKNDGDALFLMAQLYREGIGVRKNLTRAIEFLDQVSLLGAADVEDEIEMIQAEIDARNKRKTKKKKKKKVAIQKQPIIKTPPTIKQVEVKPAKASKDVVTATLKTPPVVLQPDEIVLIEQQVKEQQIKESQSKKSVVKEASPAVLEEKQPVLVEPTVKEPAPLDPKAEKLRRYKEVMLKLKQEQQLIDEQQGWASGDGETTADDEI